MKNLIVSLTILASALAATAFGLDAPAKSAPPLINDFLGQVDFVEGRILALNKAMAEKETWRPAEGVRSVGEAYLHIAFGNYILLKQAGVEPPAAANFSMDIAKWDAQTTDAGKIEQILKASFDHIRSAAKAMTAEQLEKEINLFGHKMTVRNVLITTLNHMHEHLGQSIAYARMNGVVPPWTAEQETKAGAKTKPEEGAK